MPTRYLSTEDLTPDDTWRLADWCLARGADEFGVELMGLQGYAEPFNDRFLAALAPYRLPEALRPHPVTYVGQEPIRPAQRWRASPALLAVVKQFFPDGLFTYLTSPHEDGWLEDPVLYRDGEIMLGIVSHEGEGFLHLGVFEEVQLAALDIRTRDRGTWI